METPFFLEPVESLDEIHVPKRVPRIERVPIVEPVEGLVICDRLYKLPTHYYGKRTSICPGRDKCDIHKAAALRVYYLCAVWIVRNREAVWLQLPANAAKALLLGVKVLNRPLHGSSVRIERKWKDKNAPVVLKVDPYTPLHSDLPKALTPEESVRRCFFSDAEKTSTNRRKAV